LENIKSKNWGYQTVLSFDPQLKEKIYKRQISIKLFYLYQKLQCRDNYFFKIKFGFFLYLLLSAVWKKNDLLLYISDIRHWKVRQTTSGVYAITVTTSPYHSRRFGRLKVIVIWRRQGNGWINTGVETWSEFIWFEATLL
jgi:hypothetical protein